MPGLGPILEDFDLDFEHMIKHNINNIIIYITSMCVFYSFLYIIILKNINKE